jgi:hypothetical protein
MYGRFLRTSCEVLLRSFLLDILAPLWFLMIVVRSLQVAGRIYRYSETMTRMLFCSKL